MSGPAAPLIDRALAQIAATIGTSPAVGFRTVALGWATVELDRAAAELAGELGWSPDAFVPAADSDALGARCRVALRALEGGLSLVLLEPTHEGRLAARLARRDEGPAAVWFATDEDVSGQGSGARPGPLGPERDAPDGRVGGLHAFLVGPEPGTIRA